MAKIIYAGRAFADFERISDPVRNGGGDMLDVVDVLDLIDEAIGILARHPLIGRRAEADLRELVISQGHTATLPCIAMSPSMTPCWCWRSAPSARRGLKMNGPD